MIRDLDAANAIVDLEPAVNEDSCSDEEIYSENAKLEGYENYDHQLFQEEVRMTA